MKLIRIFLSAAVLCGLSHVVLAEDVKPYEWEKNRSRYTLSKTDAELSELILKQHTQYDYVLQDNQFLMYSTIHRIVYVNNDEAIQKHNRIVISMNNTLELMDVKARAISKDGKSVFFDKSNLKELKNEESGNAFKIFAIEGIEVGSEVEYFFTRKMSATIFDRVFMQFDVQVKENSFELTCPQHLKFDFKTYYNFPDVKPTENSERNVYRTSMQDVPALKEEPVSYFSANRKRVEFKLAYNTARSQARLYTWDEAAKTFYRILTTTTKDDEKAIDKYVKSLDDKPTNKLDDRIRNVENKIKKEIQVNKEGGSESQNQIASILKYKLASHQGMTSLFIAVFDRLKINCQPVVTCSRENIKFDGSFDSWSYLDDYILYFPDTKQFLEPYMFELRYPLIQPDFTAQQGLFIEPITVGEVKSALSSIGMIPPADYAISIDNLDIDVKFNDDLGSNEIRQKREFGGYNASYLAPYYDVMSADQRTNMISEIIKQTAPDATIKNSKAFVSPTQLGDNFIVDVTFQSNHFLEKAGPRILFKAGELIGSQIEMYRDDERTTVVENDFNRKYYRTIKIQIPKGYKIKNADDLKFNITYKDIDLIAFQFKSDYTIKGDVLEITIDEFYKEIYAPLSRYEDFRKVVNAAADFNKITLVLEKL
jgi:hypothetical protein